MTEWGMYVELDDTHIEGMVALREMKSDFFEFDEKRYRLVGRRTRRMYRLGDRVRIKVAAANLEQRLLDFELIEADMPDQVERDERREYEEEYGIRRSPLPRNHGKQVGAGKGARRSSAKKSHRK